MRTSLLVIALSLLHVSPSLSADSTTTILEPTGKSHLQRNFIIGNLVGGTAAYFYFTDVWGKPTGKFHFKDDTHDNLALTDEVSHMFASYQIAEGSRWLFRLLGMPQDKIEKYALLEAVLITTFIEFPLDAFNPGQGVGVSDLLFNSAGVGLSYLRHHGAAQFDMKFSLKRSPLEFENKFLASDAAEFDNFIWWGVWKPRHLWFGFGYSTNHYRADGLVEKEFYLGAGTTLHDLLNIVSPRAAKRLKALDTFFLNLHVEL
ncbi:MAG: hypothetical protein ABIJ61_09540 [bacterium]